MEEEVEEESSVNRGKRIAVFVFCSWRQKWWSIGRKGIDTMKTEAATVYHNHNCKRHKAVICGYNMLQHMVFTTILVVGLVKSRAHTSWTLVFASISQPQ